MPTTSIRIACLWLLLIAPLHAQQPSTNVPPEPRADAPQTFAEQTSPASFGTTVIAGGDGHLMVVNVSDGSAASAAGLRAGDHIVSVDGQLLTEPATFNEYIAARPASQFHIVVLRDGTQETIVVDPVGGATTTSEGHGRPAIGLRFLQGPQVIVAETVTGSPAAASGLLAGDRIISVNGDAVSSSDQFITRIATAPLDESLTLGYVRGVARSSVSIVPARWDTVFSSSYTTLKPVGSEATTVAPVFGCGAYAYPSYNPYYISNVSPVVVPLTWYGYSPYGYAYWNVPYYYGYYPQYFYRSAWPNGPYHDGPYPGPVHEAKPAKALDSASSPLSNDAQTASHFVDQP